MGIKWVLHWQPNAGNTINSQILNEISRCAESINRVTEGRWKATLTFYKLMLRANGEIWREFITISFLMKSPNPKGLLEQA